MLVAAHHLKGLGFEVTTIHPHLSGFGRWLEKGDYRLPPTELSAFDAILLQHDNTQRARQIASLRATGKCVYIFYQNHQPTQHGDVIAGLEHAFDSSKTMVENTRQATTAIFGGDVSAQTGMRPPPGLVHRRFMRRILIHPMSGNAAKNWPKQRFLKVAVHLKGMGLEPVFILSPSERAGWPEVESPLNSTLEDLATIVYESGYFIGNDSGPGHLASYLSIPNLIISGNEKNMRLWRPGWLGSRVVCPPRWLPNVKGLRLREEKWKYFVPARVVIKELASMIGEVARPPSGP